jgi:hypothetical protein
MGTGREFAIGYNLTIIGDLLIPYPSRRIARDSTTFKDGKPGIGKESESCLLGKSNQPLYREIVANPGKIIYRKPTTITFVWKKEQPLSTGN